VTEGAREQPGRHVGGISHRAAAWLAWSACAVSLLLMVFSLMLIALGWSTPLPKGWSPWRDQTISLVGSIGVPILGALIASRRPENPYGWLWVGLGLSFAFVGLAEAYAAYALVANPGSLPAPGLVNKVLASGWVVLITLLPFVLLLFPTGRLPSRRWRFVAWAVIVSGTALLPLAFFSPESGQGPVNVPFAVSGAVGKVISAVDLGAIMIIFACIILSALSLIVRYKRARGVERQQLKWFALAAALSGGLIIADQLRLDSSLGAMLWNLLGVTAFAALYVAVGIAILRHRLFDIDVVINRTLVYGSLTALLAAVYVGGVATTQALFRALTSQDQQPQVAIVISTLVIAALFNPLRRRTQAFIDRLFYRRKYDARKTLEAFGSRLRDQTDLDTLSNDMVRVARRTVQPAHASLWLRPNLEPEARNAALRQFGHDE
jgi:hypothetical protein